MDVGRRDGRKEPVSVVAELEGTLLRDVHPFPYFMLIAFEASGLIRFALLLLLWPAFRALDLLGLRRIGLRVMVFVAVAAVKESEVEMASRAVLPKFLMDDVNMEAWSAFNSFERRVVATSWPRLMVEHFARDHLGADEVVGCELDVKRFGYATGLIKSAEASVAARVARIFAGEKADVGLARKESMQSFMSFCKEEYLVPTTTAGHKGVNGLSRPRPVIFHDGRLVRRPTPFTALLIILWIPLGVVLAIIRMVLGLMVPLWSIPYLVRPLGGELIVRGRIPQRVSGSTNGVLFVCTHRTLMDPVVLSVVLGRSVPAVTYSISRLSEILSPIRTVRLSRDRQVDAECIKKELAKGDLVVCPEGTTCREPFLLRFSALFAELTDRIVPVAINYHVGFFHATTARGWKAMDPVFFFMNPKPVYELTFLNQLPAEATCAAGKSPHDVANYVQRILAATLGFECTNFTRKDKYRVLTGNDGSVGALKAATPWVARVEECLDSCSTERCT